MASETNNETPEPSFIHRLISSRNRDLSQLDPFILHFTNREINPSSVQESSNLNQESQETSTGHRVVLINSVTQDTVVIESPRSINLDSLFNNLFSSKDGQPPASKSSIEAMQSLEISEINSEGECVVCLEEWKVGQIAKEMPCKHRFHRECIEKWLEIRGTCPVCRYNMPVEDYQDENNKNENRGRRMIRREIWINFAIGSGRRTSISDSSESSGS